MNVKKISLIVSTFFNIGNIKYAPGTLASFITLLIWCLIVPSDLFLRLIISFLLIIIGFFSIEYSLDFFNDDDPQNIVIDEVVGMSIPMIFITEPILAIISFLFFRLLDIFKPSIIYYAQFYKRANGILLDDVLSGVITLIILYNYL